MGFYLKNKVKSKGRGHGSNGGALAGNCEALSSNPSTTKKVLELRSYTQV
jgi:hypothetical protein